MGLRNAGFVRAGFRRGNAATGGAGLGTITGIVKATVGVASAAIAGTDYATPASVAALTYATVYAQGTAPASSTVTLDATRGGLVLDGTALTASASLLVKNGKALSGVEVQVTGTAATGFVLRDSAGVQQGALGLNVAANEWDTPSLAGDLVLVGPAAAGKGIVISLPASAGAGGRIEILTPAGVVGTNNGYLSLSETTGTKIGYNASKITFVSAATFSGPLAIDASTSLTAVSLQVTGDPNTGAGQIGGADTFSTVVGGVEALRSTIVAASGDLLAGTGLQSLAANMTIFTPVGTGTLMLAYYNGAAWKSAIEYTATTGSATTTLRLLKGGGAITMGGATAFTAAATAIQETSTFAPTSGSAAYNAHGIQYTVNQTGGANGAVTGLYINATRTAVVGTHRAVWVQMDGADFISIKPAQSSADAVIDYNSATEYSDAWTVNYRLAGVVKGTIKASSTGSTFSFQSALNVQMLSSAGSVYLSATSGNVLLSTGNIALFSLSGSFGSGVGMVFIANRTTAPTTAVVGGGVLYTEAGALKYKGSTGTVTQIAPP